MKKITTQELYKIYLQFPEITTDSRKCRAGAIFFALKGDNFNGNKFALNAIESGCEYAVIDEPEYAVNDKILLVNDVLESLQSLATFHREHLNIPIFGVTGTNGKTTTKELLNCVLSKKYNVLATEGNLNNHIGVPLTILKITKKHDFAIIEMGANHPGEIEFLCNITKPDYGLITNVGKAHLQGFGSLEGVVKTKTELYKALAEKNGKIFIYAGNKELFEKVPYPKSELIIYGDNKDALVKGEVTIANPFVCFDFVLADKKYSVKTNLVGTYNMPNFLASICVGHYFGVDTDKICEALSEYEPSNKRSQFVKTENNSVILDAYNANPGSMSVALKNFKEIEGDNKTLILGDMRELGDESEKEHKAILKLINEYEFTDVYLVGEEFAKIIQPENSFRSFKRIDDLREFLVINKLYKRCILVKGARGISLEKIMDIL